MVALALQNSRPMIFNDVLVTYEETVYYIISVIQPGGQLCNVTVLCYILKTLLVKKYKTYLSNI